MTRTRKLHRLLGCLLLLPLFGWALTGAVFFIKPGYKSAFEPLTIKTYPLQQNTIITPGADWQQVKLVKTVLGRHLLVQHNGQWQHLQPEHNTPMALPAETQIRLLLQDAMTSNPERYGHIVDLDGTRARTSTGVNIRLNWNTLSLQQEGKDTRLINGLYRVHYLQWLPSGLLNQGLGLLGLGLLMSMALLGLRLCWRRPTPR
ncbi:PepSY domain-containing protein [Oceanimonas baumannii]|uniref:PepSY-associated transmembrane protein n=1 Tax=Oceanimonas baumannii TaxID=129578 RepID=A0A235CM95_9GAMM|nr:PepSY domain-containing protein [Oceanimonas baumannii]OYD25147.1 hypothetical protein B6S09_05535 [Oceanimonas baumannii]TDW62568.1 PepSY-associated transmembrane protein [Oceanimonas baumannii]